MTLFSYHNRTMAIGQTEGPAAAAADIPRRTYAGGGWSLLCNVLSFMCIRNHLRSEIFFRTLK
jgi:hypothetical protein